MQNLWQRNRWILRTVQIALVAGLLAAAGIEAQQTSAAPAQPQQAMPAHIPELRHTAPPRPSMLITLDEAILLAKKNNPSLQATRTLTYQGKEQEVTANLRPNPVLGWDAQFLPIFNPGNFTGDYINNVAEFDVSLGYLFERGRKRQHRLAAAKNATAVTEWQVADAERTTVGAVAQQYVAVLLADANLELASDLLAHYKQAVGVGRERYRAGEVNKPDLLKIQLQTLQFQNDVASAEVARVQALAMLRQLLGFDSVPRDFDVSGKLAYTPLTLHLEDLQAKALKLRPDLQAAQRSIAAARSQIELAKADAKQDLNFTFDYSHVAASNNGSFIFSIPLPIFNRNQGEVAKDYYALTQNGISGEGGRTGGAHRRSQCLRKLPEQRRCAAALRERLSRPVTRIAGYVAGFLPARQYDAD